MEDIPMLDIENGRSNLVFEVVRKDSYAVLADFVDRTNVPGMVVSVYENRYLKKIADNVNIESFVIHPDKSQFIDPRVLRDRTVMIIQDFLAKNDQGLMLLDVLEELGKRLSPDEMVKTVEIITSFKSCRHTILVTLNPLVMPKETLKRISSLFDVIQDVRAASMGGDNVECPDCGAMWDSLVTTCSLCGYNIRKNTIRVSTPAGIRTSKQHKVSSPISSQPTSKSVTETVKPTNELALERHTEHLGDSFKEKEDFLENLTFKFLTAEKTTQEKSPPVKETKPSFDWFSRGVSLELKGDSWGALEAYNKALEHNPRDPWVHLNKGVALQRLGRLDEAMEAYDESIRLDPEDQDAWSNRATVLRNLGKLEEAVESYRRALELAPGDGGIWSNLGIALRTMGNHDEALEAYESALSMNPGDISIWLNKAAVLISMDRLQDAMECYDHILSVDPENRGVKELKRFLRRRISNKEV